jgi:hypothetical protein
LKGHKFHGTLKTLTQVACDCHLKACTQVEHTWDQLVSFHTWYEKQFYHLSESGFVMDNETLQLLIGHFEELKTDINGVKMELKTEINAVSASQEELKNDMKSEISAVKNELRQEISAKGKTVPYRTYSVVTDINACLNFNRKVYALTEVRHNV